MKTAYKQSVRFKC